MKVKIELEGMLEGKNLNLVIILFSFPKNT